MSDQQDKNIEQLAQETAAAGEDIQVDDAPQEAPHTVAAPPGSSVSEPEPARRGSSSVVAWLALLAFWATRADALLALASSHPHG